MFRDLNLKPLIAAMAAASLLTACGGGGGGSDPEPTQPGGQQPGGQQPGGQQPGGEQPGGEQPGGQQPGGEQPGGEQPGGEQPAPVDPQRTTMSCPEGEGAQCSGETVLQTDNNVLLSNSGVHVIARSTSDELTPNPNKTTPSGMRLHDQGKADVRVVRDASGAVTSTTLLLSDLGIKWGSPDGAERPLIIETFGREQNRVSLDAAGKAVKSILPGYTETGFYDLVTQANYANNIYYPRPGTTCPEDTIAEGCEATVIRSTQGADGAPNWFGVRRLHNDGDVHAGSNAAEPTGDGVPFPGSKGYRALNGYNYTYSNLSTWLTQDTVTMAEWGGNGADEHNTMRRGVSTFGQVTDPAAVPTTGTASYTGIIYGYYYTTGMVDPEMVYGRSTVTVDFATRAVNVTFSNVSLFNAEATPVPLLNFSTSATGGEYGTKFANYMTGPIANASFNGGLSARYFGPVANGGPAEIGGALRLTGSGSTLIAGFIGRKD